MDFGFRIADLLKSRPRKIYIFINSNRNCFKGEEKCEFKDEWNRIEPVRLKQQAENEASKLCKVVVLYPLFLFLKSANRNPKSEIERP